jgi:hypothetical protein
VKYLVDPYNLGRGERLRQRTKGGSDDNTTGNVQPLSRERNTLAFRVSAHKMSGTPTEFSVDTLPLLAIAQNLFWQ